MAAKRWLLIVVIVTITATFQIYVSSPQRLISKVQAQEVALLHGLTEHTLWDLGFNLQDFIDLADTKPADWQGAWWTPGSNALFKDIAFERVAEAASNPRRARYLLSQPKEPLRGLYTISFKNSEHKGFTLIIRDLEDESRGRFIGFVFHGDDNAKLKWFTYENTELGELLRELRSGETR